jgi:nucleoside-diphosphate kinase
LCAHPLHTRQVLALVFEGKGVIAAGRKMIGSTNPLDADPSTIRGQNCIDVGRNCIHGSDSVDAAQREISLWFGSGELSSYQRVHDVWVYE